MATESVSAPTNIPIGADAKLRVSVETGTAQEASGGKHEEKGQASVKQILASLAETKKYLPNQVYTFLDSMEGKTLDDLRIEALHLANKAQEEAKKRAEDVTNYGKSIVENANQKVQGVTDMAKDRTNDVASGLANKGRDMVQPPLQATKDATKSLAMKGMEKGSDIALQTWRMASQRFLPYVTPYANKARTYLPTPANSFLEKNIDGKSLEELRNVALSSTRKNLLSVTKETPPSSLTEIVGEVKDAAFSGDLFRNSLSLSEQAANSLFGQSEVPKDASSLRRMYNLTSKVTCGVKDIANKQINQATNQAFDMWRSRVNQARGMAMQRVDQVKDTVAPVVERVGATPVVPGFVYKLLREGQPTESSESTKSSIPGSTQAIPATTVRIDIVGMQPKEDVLQGSALSSDKPPSANQALSAPQKDASTIPSEQVSSGPTSTTDKDKKTSPMGRKDESQKGSEQQQTSGGNTNAQGMGETGAAGMGVTTTGGEIQQGESGEGGPGEHAEHKSSKKKHHNTKM